MFNVREAEIGKALVFLSGGQATVSDMKVGIDKVTFHLVGFDTLLVLNFDGTNVAGSTSPLDVVGITEPKFQWTQAKRGMAFVVDNDEDDIVYFQGLGFFDGDVVVESKEYGGGTQDKESLSRSPRHDLV